MENLHYVCTGGCLGVSKTPGVCNSWNCEKKGHTLIECNCIDGKHEGVVDQEIEENKELGKD